MPDTPWPSGEMLAELESLRRKVAHLDNLRNEAHRLAEDLAALETRYHALYDHGPMLCVIVDSEGTVLDSNDAVTASLGYTSEQLAGMTFGDMVVPERGSDARGRLERAFRGDLSEKLEVGLRSESGAIRRVILLSAITRPDIRGRSDGVLIAGSDVTAQRHAEAALELGDRQYQALVECLPTPVCAFDTDHRFVFANWAAADAFEATAKSLLGRSLHEFVSEEDWDLILERTSDLRDGGTRPYDISIIRPDGTARSASVHAALRHNSGGTATGVVMALQAVTEHRTVERALQESKERYRSLFEESIDVIYVTAQDGRLLDISPSAVSLFGYTRDELLERDVHGLYADPEQRVKFQEAIERQGFVRGFEITLLHKDGRKIDCVLASTIRKGADGRTLGYQGIMRDVTDRKRAEAGRERERRTFRVIAEAAVRSTDIADLCSRVLTGLVEVLEFDAGTLRLHDGRRGVLEPVAIVGLRDDEHALISEQSIGEDQNCTAAHVARTGAPIFASDVTVHPISESHRERLDALGIRSLVAYPIFGASRNLLAVMQLFSRTVTDLHEENDGLFFETVAGMLAAVIEKKLTEDQKRDVEAQLVQSQKMEAIGTLASGVAHDFNNLLTAILGFTELTLMSVNESDRIFGDLEKIRSAANRGAGLVRQLLLFGREQPVQLHAVDINATTQGMVKILSPLIGEDITVRTLLEPDLRPAMADEGSIQQVLMNLAVNARDAMPEGGSLTIRTRNVRFDEANDSDNPDAKTGDFVCISVEDSGGGMSPDTITRIFEPFFSTKGPGKGTGLGLSVAYGIVRQHGGWIYTLSTPKMGTTFEIYIPIASTEPAARLVSCQEEQRHEAGSGERILVVEDEESVRDLATTILRKSGYQVFEAANVADAISIFEQEEGNFDLVFSDVVLPDKSGVQLADELLERAPGLHMLMSSGHASRRSQWETIRDRGLPFLQKPYSLPGLLKMVRETIRSG
ncbi:MAG: PAS domain S-box protein [Candidatus Eisenbacteria sp.]|nr:PAS domain S-box protein [Candidatus Eisenbacteria bacterium]